MLRMLVWWAETYHFDGFRCDAAHVVPAAFWEEVRTCFDEVRSDFVLLAEANHPNLLERAFDADYGWAFYGTLNEVIRNGRPARALRETWISEQARYGDSALHMMFLDNHDQSRAIARFGDMGTLAASALVFAMDGIPMIYNGMEAGDTSESGAPALFEHVPILWEISERRPQFRSALKEMITLRRDHCALRVGALEWLDNTEDARLVTLLRRYRDCAIVVAVNLSNQPVRARIVLDGWRYQSLGNAAAHLPDIEMGAWEYRYYAGTG